MPGKVPTRLRESEGGSEGSLRTSKFVCLFIIYQHHQYRRISQDVKVCLFIDHLSASFISIISIACEFLHVKVPTFECRGYPLFTNGSSIWDVKVVTFECRGI